MNRVDFLAFMCRVMNMSDQVKKKSARIDVVVREAKDFLGITEATGVMMHEMLNQPRGDVGTSFLVWFLRSFNETLEA